MLPFLPPLECLSAPTSSTPSTFRTTPITNIFSFQTTDISSDCYGLTFPSQFTRGTQQRTSFLTQPIRTDLHLPSSNPSPSAFNIQ